MPDEAFLYYILLQNAQAGDNTDISNVHVASNDYVGRDAAIVCVS